MELNRLLRVLRHRWRVVVFLALIGSVSAIGFTTLANRNASNLYEALIPIRFEADEGETIEDLADEVDDARGLAVLAAGDLLVEYPNSSIFSDRGSGRLIFLAQGDTTDQALERATALVEAYFETDPVVGGDVNELLAGYAQEAADLQAQIDELQPSLSFTQQNLIARHELLNQQIAAVRGRIVALTVADAVASEEQRAENATERTRLESIRAELQAELSRLAPLPSAKLSVADRLRRDALQRGLDLLSVDYERLALRTLGVASGGRLEPATFSDLSPEPASQLTNGLVGLLGGVGLAIMAVMFVTRARGEFWLPEDLSIPLLAEVPSRKLSPMSGPPWYDSAEAGRRKESIQALRTALEGAIGSEGLAVAVLGDKVDSSSGQALAVDLSTSFASAGRTVLVVDANYAKPATFSEYDVGEPDLQSILGLTVGSEETLRGQVRHLLRETNHIRPELAVMPAGITPPSPADAVAGSQFRILLEEARALFDIVIIVAGGSKSPAALVTTQRVGTAIIVVEPGASTVSGINSLLTDLVHQRVAVLGAVAIHGSERRLPLPALKTPDVPRNDAEPVKTSSASDRPSRYPLPGSTASGVISGGTMRELADELADPASWRESVGAPSTATTDALGSQVLDAARNSDNGRAYLPVAQYVMARIEDVMTAVAGQANVSSGTLDVILQYGFVPFKSTQDHASIGDQLVMELCDELGQETGQKLADEFSRILGGEGKDPVEALNDWIAKEFFVRHIERTRREPEVWHLTSEDGTIQLLVNGRHLDKDRLDRINVDIVRRSLESYQRALEEANEFGDRAQASTIEAKLREIQLFEISLGLLQVGSREKSRLSPPWKRDSRQPGGWDPVWTEGAQANIAPLQRLGLLAAPVLTDEELTLDQTTA